MRSACGEGNLVTCLFVCLFKVDQFLHPIPSKLIYIKNYQYYYQRQYANECTGLEYERESSGKGGKMLWISKNIPLVHLL